MARLNSYLLLLIFPFAFSITAHCHDNLPQRKKHATLFIFGDSFLDAGNNNYINTTSLDRANFWPYGETYFKSPTGRFSDGRLVSDFIAEKANLSLIPPFLQPRISQYHNGINFASAGAGTLVETFRGSVIDLKTQLRNFKKLKGRVLNHKFGQREAQKIVSKAVYLISIGSNDYISLFLTNSSILSSYSNSTYVGMVIGNLTSIIKGIYKRGGRKFGFINLPPLGCLPGMRIISSNGSCLEEASMLAASHNQALSKMLLELERQLKGFCCYVYDFNSNLGHIMRQPSKYGFKDGIAACCGTGPYRGVFSCGGKRPVTKFQLCNNPNEHVFWDSLHLTEMAYKLIARQMWNGEGNSHPFGSHNLKTLFFQ